MEARKHYLDNLRTFMIFLVILYHSGFVYLSSLESAWIVVDSDRIESLGLIGMYLDLFVMFTLFFISGYFSPASVRKVSTKKFVVGKFKRLIIPWLVGVFALIPIYKILFLHSRGLPQEEWFSYFHWYERTGSDLSFFANNPVQNWLWFLPILFLFQVSYILIGKSIPWDRISSKSLLVFILIIGVAYSMTISELGLKGWHNSILLHFQRERLLPYLLIFLSGAYCSHRQLLELTLSKRSYIVLNIVLSVGITLYTGLALNLFFNMLDPGRNYFFISSFADRSTYYLFALLNMMAILYLLINAFRSKLNYSNKWLSELNKNSYYVYVIHMIILGLVGYAVSLFEIPVVLKYLLVLTGTYVICNILISVYRKLFQPKPIMKIALGSITVLFLVLSISNNSNGEEIQAAQSQNLQQSSLHEMILSNDLESIKQMISNKADLNVKEPSGGSTPLITAAFFGRTEAAKLLIEAGADLDLTNNDGSTALHTAAFFCRVNIVEKLLDAGADKNILNNSGARAVDSVSGDFETVKPIYDYFTEAFQSFGFELDYEMLKKERPRVAEMLK